MKSSLENVSTYFLGVGRAFGAHLEPPDTLEEEERGNGEDDSPSVRPVCVCVCRSISPSFLQPALIAATIMSGIEGRQGRLLYLS